jgi:hypothetical protein
MPERLRRNRPHPLRQRRGGPGLGVDSTPSPRPRGHPRYGGYVGNFDDLTDRVFKLYAGGEHTSALSLAESGFEQFPNRLATLTYWCACLRSLLGDPASALEDFKDGLAAGLWWRSRRCARTRTWTACDSSMPSRPF